MSNFVDYYTILKISPKATQEEIRQAYKKEALISHPDRLPETATDEDRRQATRQFQLVADAYHILGDTSRRAAYDQARARQGSTPFAAHATPTTSSETAHNMFSSAFEELLKDEVEHPTYIWRMLGAGAGLVIGFILANVGGAMMGALAGKTLGQIRDRKGVSVYTAFERLGAAEKKKILSALLTQFLTQGAVGSMK